MSTTVHLLMSKTVKVDEFRRRLIRHTLPVHNYILKWQDSGRQFHGAQTQDSLGVCAKKHQLCVCAVKHQLCVCVVKHQLLDCAMKKHQLLDCAMKFVSLCNEALIVRLCNEVFNIC